MQAVEVPILEASPVTIFPKAIDHVYSAGTPSLPEPLGWGGMAAVEGRTTKIRMYFDVLKKLSGYHPLQQKIFLLGLRNGPCPLSRLC